MEKLTQELTSSLGFCNVINTNNNATADKPVAALARKVTLEDGTEVTVEGMTPYAIKSALNSQIASADAVSFATPGEPVQAYTNPDKIGPTETTVLNGVVQVYNTDSAEEKPEITSFTINPVTGLAGNLEVGTVVATTDIIGGTGPYTTSFIDEDNDNGKFEIYGSDIKVAGGNLNEGTYNIEVLASDINGKTKTATATIEVAAQTN